MTAGGKSSRPSPIPPWESLTVEDLLAKGLSEKEAKRVLEDPKKSKKYVCTEFKTELQRKRAEAVEAQSKVSAPQELVRTEVVARERDHCTRITLSDIGGTN